MTRSTIAALLLLVLVGAASGAGTVLCATHCAGARQQQSLPVAASAHHQHHHQSALTTVPGATAFSAAKSPHCARSAPPVLAKRSGPQAPSTAAVVGVLTARAVPPVSSAERTSMALAATPPGPPVLPTPLRI